MSFSDRLQYLIDLKGVKKSNVGVDNKMSPSTIANYLNGITNPTPSNIRTLANYFEVNEEWLKTGEGEMRDVKKPFESNIKEIDPTIMMVELVSKQAQAGYLCGFGDDEYIESLPKIPVVVDHNGKGNYKCFEVKGDSMCDDSYMSYIDGDVVLGREISKHLWRPKLHYNKVDFIIVHKDGVIIKRIINQDPNTGRITLHSLNPDKGLFPDYDIFLDDCYQIFSVVEIVRRKMMR